MENNKEKIKGMIYITSSFWSNTIWYILLGVLTVIQMVVILRIDKNVKYIMVLFFVISGMTFTFEATILFFNAYDYYPLIMPKTPIYDTMAGNLFSQFSVTSTALLIAVLNLKYYWFFVFSIIYGIIEELFIKFGLYKHHHWYKTWMTMLGLLILFGVTKYVYKNKYMFKKPILRYFFMLHGLFTLHMPTAWWIQMLSGILTLNTKILPYPMSSFVLICVSNLFLISISCMFIYYSKLKWYWKSMIVLILYCVLYVAYKFALIYVNIKGWFLIFASIDIGGMFLYIFILDKLFPPIKCDHV
ncbi:MAG: hypothetical protein ACOYVK_18755 [Bacillota bacterium]